MRLTAKPIEELSAPRKLTTRSQAISVSKEEEVSYERKRFWLQKPHLNRLVLIEFQARLWCGQHAEEWKRLGTHILREWNTRELVNNPHLCWRSFMILSFNRSYRQTKIMQTVAFPCRRPEVMNYFSKKNFYRSEYCHKRCDDPPVSQSIEQDLQHYAEHCIVEWCTVTDI